MNSRLLATGFTSALASFIFTAAVHGATALTLPFYEGFETMNPSNPPAAFLNPPSSLYATVVNGDPNNPSSYNYNAGSSAVVAATQHLDGAKAIRFELHPGDAGYIYETHYAQVIRAELQIDGVVTAYPPVGQSGATRWYGIGIYVHPDWTDTSTDPNGTVVAQWHSKKDLNEQTKSPHLSIQVTKDNRWRVRNIWDDQVLTDPDTLAAQGKRIDYDCGPVVKGEWNSWVVYAKWDYRANGVGALQVWRNGVLVVERSGPNCYNDGSTTSCFEFFKFGIYKSWWADHPPVQPPNDTDKFLVWHDALRIRDGNAAFGDVSPAGLPMGANHFTATVVGAGRVDLAWDDSQNETQYLIERKVGAGSYGLLATKTVNQTAHSDYVVPGTSYTYRIRTQNGQGFSDYSPAVTVTTPAATPGGNWRFDEGTGTIANDSSGNAHTGTVIGATWTTGQSNAGLSFDGLNDEVTIPDANDLDFTNTIYIDARINFASGTTPNAPATTVYRVLGKNPSSGGAEQYGVRIKGGKVGLAWAGGAWIESSAVSWSLGQWYRLEVTHNGSTITFKRDGAVIGTANNTADAAASTGTLFIGSGISGFKNWFKGKIDEVSVRAVP